MNSHDQPTPEVLDYVKKLKSNGTFDQFRRECLTDIDSKVSCLEIKVKTYVFKSLFKAIFSKFKKKSRKLCK